MTRLRALAVPVLTACIQLGAAWIAIGPPDLGRALAFLTGDLTMAGAIAASVLMVWLVVLVVAAWTLVAVVADVRRAADLAVPLARSWELAVLVAGLIVLAGGVVHHLSGAPLELGGGSVQQARSLAGG